MARDGERGRDGALADRHRGRPTVRREAQREKPQPYMQDRPRRRTPEDTTMVNSKNPTEDTAPLLIKRILM